MQGTSYILCFVIFFEITALIAGGQQTKRECQDTFHSCVSWSNAGMCDNKKFGFVMRGGCGKTCGFCEDSTKSTIHISAQNSKSKQNTEKDDENKSSKSLSATSTTPTTATTPTTPTSATTPTTHPTRTTVTRHTTPTTKSTTITTSSTYSTPTTHTTATTRPIFSTPTTSPTQAFPSDEKDKPKSVKTKSNDKKAKKQKCDDLFNKCEEWKEKKNICKSPKFKSYMEFGCARTCSLCSVPGEDSNIASRRDGDSVNVEVGDKKSILAHVPKSRTKDIDSRLDDVVEIGIAREMIQANEKRENKGHFSKTLHGKNTKNEKRSKTARSKIPLKKYIMKPKKKETLPSKNTNKRVEIEDGFKSDSNPFSNLKEVTNGVDKVDLQTAVLGSEAEFKTNTLDALNRDLPDFGGLDNVGDVEKILETPKPKKKLDYYVDHFSSDPYEAESEKEQWLQENSNPKQYRRHVRDTNRQGKAPSTSPHSSAISNAKSNYKPRQQVQGKQNENNMRKSNSKRVEIEDGFKSQSPLISNFNGVSHEISKVDSPISDLGSKANMALLNEGFGGKAVEVESLAKLADIDGLNNRKDVQELFETPTNKKFDYYVEHFSNDPYLAESEKQEWMKDNDARMKQYRRRLEDTKMTQSEKQKNVK